MAFPSYHLIGLGPMNPAPTPGIPKQTDALAFRPRTIASISRPTRIAIRPRNPQPQHPFRLTRPTLHVYRLGLCLHRVRTHGSHGFTERHSIFSLECHRRTLEDCQKSRARLQFPIPSPPCLCFGSGISSSQRAGAFGVGAWIEWYGFWK